MPTMVLGSREPSVDPYHPLRPQLPFEDVVSRFSTKSEMLPWLAQLSEDILLLKDLESAESFLKINSGNMHDILWNQDVREPSVVSRLEN